MSDLIIRDRKMTQLEKEMVTKTGLDKFFVFDWMSLDLCDEDLEYGEYEDALEDIHNDRSALESLAHAIHKSLIVLDGFEARIQDEMLRGRIHEDD